MFELKLILYLILAALVAGLISKIYTRIYVSYYARNGIELFTPELIQALINSKCMDSGTNIPILSIGNSIMIKDKGIVLLCADSRNVKLKEFEPNVGLGITPSDSYKRWRVDIYSLIHKLIKEIKKEYKSNTVDKTHFWLGFVQSFRDGLLGHLQSKDFDSHWNNGYKFSNHESFYDDIPYSCPECGYCIGKDLNYDEVRRSGCCTSCGIQTNQMYTFRDSYVEDVYKLENLLKDF